MARQRKARAGANARRRPHPPGPEGATYDERGTLITPGCIVVDNNGPLPGVVGRVVAAHDGVLLYRAFDCQRIRPNHSGGKTLYGEGNEVTVIERPNLLPETPRLGILSRESIYTAMRLATIGAEIFNAEARGGTPDGAFQRAEKHVMAAVDLLWSVALYHVMPSEFSLKLAQAVERDDQCEDKGRAEPLLGHASTLTMG